MGTIVTRKRKDGSTGYMAQIAIRRDGEMFRETKTFDRKQAARIWIEKREAELSKPGAIERAMTVDPTLTEAIDRYLAESRKAMGRTKEQVLRAIKTMPIAEMRCSKITSNAIVEFTADLGDGRTPQTVQNYLSHLSAIFAIARPAWGYPLDQQAMKDAMAVTKRLGMTSKSRQRERRPEPDEMAKLMYFFADRKSRRPSSAPMHKIVAFAMFSTRRLEEITRIAWADFDSNRIMVRDMKNPGDKIGNNVWCDLPAEAVAIIESMPRDSSQIFPYSPDAIGAAFTRACKTLGISDLHFHDLRHEGVSRLFELGLNIPQVAAVSGHRSWTSLKRYTHLRHTGDRWAGAQWLALATAPSGPPAR
jgi:integrase